MTTKRTKKITYLSAQPQANAQPHPVRIKELYLDRAMYENYPPYQRRKVWPQKYQQALINTILRGRNFPSLVAYKQIDELGNQTFWIKDGQQRLTAIFDFMDGKFKTWTAAQKENYEPNSELPVAGGKYFQELDQKDKNIFYDYIVNISLDPRTTEDEEREHFRSSQNHVPLSPAERIDTYISKAKAAAELIEQHQFWSEFYIAEKRDRKKILQSSFFLLAMEMAPDGMIGLSERLIHTWSSGKRDNLITEELVDRVIARLDAVCVIFSGTQFTIRATAIPMYQAVLLVENLGILIRSETDKGRLSSWIKAVTQESNDVPGVRGYQRPLQQLTSKAPQRLFWEKNRKIVLDAFGLRDTVVQI